jgi:demethylmenaquinone methyltransferase/2-methoxy-6-polyprenyl-1,4-benzoquinol methylase
MKFDPSARSMEGIFDPIADVYDRRNDLLSLTFDSRWRSELVKELGGDGRVLDLAAGTGRTAGELIRTEGCEVVGLDISRRMLSVAKALGERFHPVQGDALHLPFRDGSFGRVMMSYGLRNLPDISEAIEECHRVLWAGGRLGIVEITIPYCTLALPPFLFYVEKIVPHIGFRGDEGSYVYLKESILRFPPPEVIDRMLTDRGFKVLLSRPQTRGVSHLWIAERVHS